MADYKVGDKFEIEIESVYDDDTATINVKTNEIKDNKLYRIKGFKSLVFDEDGLNKLKKIEPEAAPRTVKASELAVDTKVYCWNKNEMLGEVRCFATFFNGGMYSYVSGYTSYDTCKHLIDWEHMALEDGTVVLPE